MKIKQPKLWNGFEINPSKAILDKMVKDLESGDSEGFDLIINIAFRYIMNVQKLKTEEKGVARTYDTLGQSDEVFRDALNYVDPKERKYFTAIDKTHGKCFGIKK